MSKYILAVDQGTSGTKAVLFDRKGKLIHRSTVYHEQYYPQPGWVEHDAEEIYDKTLEAIRETVKTSGVGADDLAALALTNQRETAVVWNKATGKPVYRAVVWQCQRGSEVCRQLKNSGHQKMVGEKTGLVIDPYFSASKIQWILDHVPGAREDAERGRLLCGTMDAWLTWKLTGGRSHATDYSNACRTMLYNIKDLRWDDELLGLFNIPRFMLPGVKPSDEIAGYTDAGGIFGHAIPIAGLMGDSQAALFGQRCFEPGMVKATYGTGSSIVMNIGKAFRASGSGIVTSLGWGMGGQVQYIFEGNVHCTGAVIKWLADQAGLLCDAKSAGPLAASLDDNGGVYLVPAFVGLGAPHWNNEARAMISGMTMGTNKVHIVRAGEESIAYQIKEVVDLMSEEAGLRIREVRADGGPTRDEFLMQFQADMLDTPVVCAGIEELSALGSAFMAGLAVGFWKDVAELGALPLENRTYISRMEEAQREKNYSGWKNAVRKALCQ
ncbi:MAG: glycerol kinase GlpK [Bacillota bacterium]